LRKPISSSKEQWIFSCYEALHARRFEGVKGTSYLLNIIRLDHRKR